jgi:ribosome assembly protein RRB1
MSSHINALAETKTETGVQGVAGVQVPLQKFKHKDEGYAIDWCPLVDGRLLSGIFIIFLTLFRVLATHSL